MLDSIHAKRSKASRLSWKDYPTILHGISSLRYISVAREPSRVHVSHLVSGLSCKAAGLYAVWVRGSAPRAKKERAAEESASPRDVVMADAEENYGSKKSDIQELFATATSMPLPTVTPNPNAKPSFHKHVISRNYHPCTEGWTLNSHSLP